MKPPSQYTLRALLLVVTMAAIVFWFMRPPRGIGGTWLLVRGTGTSTFQFDGNMLHITNRHGTVSTPYTLLKDGDTAAIDFNGENGLQRGVYWLSNDGKTLIMAVGSGYTKRPKSLDANEVVTKAGNQSSFVRYSLQRAD